MNTPHPTDHDQAHLTAKYGPHGPTILDIVHTLGRNRARIPDITPDEVEHEARAIARRLAQHHDLTPDLVDHAGTSARRTFIAARAALTHRASDVA